MGQPAPSGRGGPKCLGVKGTGFKDAVEGMYLRSKSKIVQRMCRSWRRTNRLNGVERYIKLEQHILLSDVE